MICHRRLERMGCVQAKAHRILILRTCPQIIRPIGTTGVCAAIRAFHPIQHGAVNNLHWRSGGETPSEGLRVRSTNIAFYI
jgi:hypothetical protein